MKTQIWNNSKMDCMMCSMCIMCCGMSKMKHGQIPFAVGISSGV